MVELGWEAGVVIATLVSGLVVMAGDWIGPDFVFAVMVSFLAACRIITIDEAVEGFSQPGLLTVVILFVVAEGISQTGGMEKALNLFLGKTRSPFWAITRMFIPVTIVSGVLNNTPIVALLIPIMIAWGRRNGISIKKLLIPLSYAAVFGGTLTLIGTSTNLVVASLQAKRYEQSDPGNSSFGFFTITPYGTIYAIFGFMYTTLASLWFLPNDDTTRHSDLLFVAKVPSSSPVIGKSIRDGGFTGMERFVLLAVERNGHVTHYGRVSPEFRLEAEDQLHFCGELEQAKLYAKHFGLELLTHEGEGKSELKFDDRLDASQLERGEDLANFYVIRYLVQATVKKGSDIVGSSIRDLNFRSRFNAAVLAVKRGPNHHPGRLGDVVVEAGDIFVILAANKAAVESQGFKDTFKDIELLDEAMEKEYLTGMKVTSAFSGIGKSVHAAGLRGINGLYLVGIDRADGEELRVVHPDTIVALDDILWFAGGVAGVYYLLKIGGLEHTQATQVSKLKTDILYRQLVKVSIAYDSDLVGNTVRESHFRNRYDAVVLAIHREGHRVAADVRDVKLRAGDVLLLDTGSSFEHRHRNDIAFSLITTVPDTSPVKTRRMWWALFLGFVMIMTQFVGGALDEANVVDQELIDLFLAGVLTAGIMLATGCFNGQQARSSIDWSVYVTIAFAFGFSNAMEKSGVAGAIAEVFITISEAIGSKKASYVAIYIATALMSELVSNNAAAAIMYPIAAQLGDALGVKPSRMSVVVMLGASAGFTLPYSYQTNLMVFAAGGYRFLEFAKIGFPCQLFMIVAVLFIFLLEEHMGLAVGISFAMMAAMLAGPLVWATLSPTKREKFIPARFRKAKLKIDATSRSYDELSLVST